jgi:Carboxypeptidase regulatory-like domain
MVVDNACCCQLKNFEDGAEPAIMRREMDRYTLPKIVRWMLFPVMVLMASANCQAGFQASPSSLRSISGVVLDDRDAAPIVGAIVVVEPLADSQRDIQGIQTGRDGSFKVTVSPGSQYRIRVQKQGFISLLRMVSATEASTTPTLIDLGEIRLVAQCAIAGKILDMDQQPLARATVQLSRMILEGIQAVRLGAGDLLCRSLFSGSCRFSRFTKNSCHR